MYAIAGVGLACIPGPLQWKTTGRPDLEQASQVKGTATWRLSGIQSSPWEGPADTRGNPQSAVHHADSFAERELSHQSGELANDLPVSSALQNMAGSNHVLRSSDSSWQEFLRRQDLG